MTSTYDELELLPKVVPSARHANRTLCCDITAADHETGKKLSQTMKEVYGDATLLSLPREGFCRGLKNGNVFVYSRGMDIPLASGAYTVGKPNASERAEIRSLVEEHQLLTHSKESGAILSDWDESDCGFVRISATV